jgi:hypothetical protein
MISLRKSTLPWAGYDWLHRVLYHHKSIAPLLFDFQCRTALQITESDIQIDVFFLYLPFLKTQVKVVGTSLAK